MRIRLPHSVRRSAAFTLLEMLVVILIIGILSSALAINVPKWIDNAKMTASEANMKKMFMYLTEYQGNTGNWPAESGQRFFLKPWKDGQIERVPQNAEIFFSPAWGFEQCALDMGYESGEIDIVEYLNDWDAIGPGYTSYAGFSSRGDRESRRSLQQNPGSTTIVSDARWYHRNAMIYMTADGYLHRLLTAEVTDATGLTEEDVKYMEPGPGCEVPELQTVSND